LSFCGILAGISDRMYRVGLIDEAGVA
jgi:hypothetical protein